MNGKIEKHNVELVTALLVIAGIASILASVLFPNGLIHDLLYTLGTSLMTGGLVSLLYQRYLDSHFQARLTNRFEDIHARLDTISRVGSEVALIQHIDTNRRYVLNEYLSIIENAKPGTVIKFMGISLVSVLDAPGVYDLIKSKATEGVKFKFLILTKDSVYVNYRQKEYAPKSGLDTEIDQFATFIKTLQSELPSPQHDNIELRYYNWFPRMFYLSNDSSSYVQFYLYGISEFTGPTLQFNKKSSAIALQLEECFDYIWGNLRAKGSE